MKVYIPSTVSSVYGTLGRGWHESQLIADRSNVSEQEISDFFKALIDTDMALPAKAEDKKVDTTRTATSKSSTTKQRNNE